MAVTVTTSLLLCSFLVLHVKVQGRGPETLSVVLGKVRGDAEEFVQIISPPASIDNSKLLTVEYTCSEKSVVGVELVVRRGLNLPVLTFRKRWNCDAGQSHRKRRLRLRLSDDLGFRPGYFNRGYNFGVRPSLRAWVLKDALYRSLRDKSLLYVRANVKVSHNIVVTMPYSRPRWKPYHACVSWRVALLRRIPKWNDPVCPYEHGKLTFMRNRHISGVSVTYNNTRPSCFHGWHAKHIGIFREVPNTWENKRYFECLK